MKVEDVRKLLAEAVDDEEPVVIPTSVLAKLKLDDIPEGVSFQIGMLKDRVIHLDWEGRLYRRGATLEAEAEHIWTRKYWYAPLGLEQYMDLVRRAVETRHRLREDVELSHWDDDGAYIQLLYVIKTGEANDSTEPRLRRESALLLVECKNWNSKCGKDEFVIFREKLENRNRRSSLGFLISWNGFTSTVTKEMLRGSREETLIVPITGEEIRAAMRKGNFLEELVACWDRAVTL